MSLSIHDVLHALTLQQPFNYGYYWLNSTDNYDILNGTVTELNSYIGGAYQQSSESISLSSFTVNI